jgi:hypothetical protein
VVLLGLGESEKLTVPLPDPLSPEVIVTQFALLLAIQPHPIPAVRLTLPTLAAAGND